MRARARAPHQTIERQSSRLARVVTPDHTSVARTGSIRVMAVDAKTPSQVEGKTKRGRENGPGSVDRLSLALEASGLGIWTIDLAFRAAEWSEPCRELLGVERGAELTEESFLERVHPDDRVLAEGRRDGGPHVQDQVGEYQPEPVPPDAGQPAHLQREAVRPAEGLGHDRLLLQRRLLRPAPHHGPVQPHLESRERRDVDAENGHARFHRDRRAGGGAEG